MDDNIYTLNTISTSYSSYITGTYTVLKGKTFIHNDTLILNSSTLQWFDCCETSEKKCPYKQRNTGIKKQELIRYTIKRNKLKCTDAPHCAMYKIKRDKE